MLLDPLPTKPKEPATQFEDPFKMVPLTPEEETEF
jgi:hypothetical protein